MRSLNFYLADLGGKALLALFVTLFLGQVLKAVNKCLKIPYTPMVLVLGIIVGILHTHIGDLGEGFDSWTTISPHTFFLIFMPPLIFESAFGTDWHTFKRELGQVLILAGPSLLICMFLTGVFFYWGLAYSNEISFQAALMFGAIISATDPVAVVALLKELGASKRFATLIEGESLMNDGTAIVMYQIMVQLVTGQRTFDFGYSLLLFIRLSLGGVVLGLVFGILCAFIIRRITNNFVLQFNLTMISAYLVFYTAESTELKVSGILSLVFLGLYMTSKGRIGISITSQAAVHHVWSYFGYVAETVIFMSAGVLIGVNIIQSDTIEYMDWLKLIGLFLMLQIIRFLGILMLFPALRKLGYGLSFKQLIVISYGGLRGAVGLLLALNVDLNDKIPIRTRQLIVFHTGGIAFLTLAVNSTTIGYMIKKLGIARVSRVNQRIMGLVLQMFEQKGKGAINSLKKKKHFNITNWQCVQKRIAVRQILPNLIKRNLLTNEDFDEAEKQIQHEQQHFGQNLECRLNTQNKKDFTKQELLVEARLRFLKVLKGYYWHSFQEGICHPSAALRLIESADRAIDHIETQMQDWEHLLNYVTGHESRCSKKMMKCCFKIKCFGGLLRKLVIHRVAQSYFICVNFIQAHESTRRVHQEIIKDEDIRYRIEEESIYQTRLAQEFLHLNFDGLYPSLAKVVQNKRAIHYSLQQMNNFIHKLEKIGKIDCKESMAILSLNFQRMQRQHFHAPEQELPNPRNLAMQCHELTTLVQNQKQLEDLIMHHSKLIQINEGESVYKQGDVSLKSIYFIARGGIVERREQVSYQMRHKIGHLFGLGNIASPQSGSTATAISFTQLIEIPIFELKKIIPQEKEELLWVEVTMHIIKNTPDRFGPLKDFDRAQVHLILSKSKLVFYDKGDIIDFSNGALFIEGKALGLCKIEINDKQNAGILPKIKDLQDSNIQSDQDEDGQSQVKSLVNNNLKEQKKKQIQQFQQQQQFIKSQRSQTDYGDLQKLQQRIKDIQSDKNHNGNGDKNGLISQYLVVENGINHQRQSHKEASVIQQTEIKIPQQFDDVISYKTKQRLKSIPNRQMRRDSTLSLYRAFRFIYPMDDMKAQATEDCVLFILPYDMKDSWFSFHSALSRLQKLDAGKLGQQVSNIHSIGIPSQLQQKNPLKRINTQDFSKYANRLQNKQQLSKAQLFNRNGSLGIIQKSPKIKKKMSLLGSPQTARKLSAQLSALDLQEKNQDDEDHETDKEESFTN